MKRLRPDQDAFGRVLLAVQNGRRQAATVIERDDGYMEAEPAADYFDGIRRWRAVERRALRHIRGRVLDVGVGAGRVALELQGRGHKVVAIDVSPLVVRVARKRGVRNARVLSLEEVDKSLGRIDTVAMFMNNFGLFENEAKAKRLLQRLHGLTSEQGRIVASSSDVLKSARAEHRAYHRRNRSRGRMPGQIRMRLHCGKTHTPWFDWLFVSPRELERLLRGTGWHVHRVLRDEEYSHFYVAVIDKDEVR